MDQDVLHAQFCAHSNRPGFQRPPANPCSSGPQDSSGLSCPQRGKGVLGDFKALSQLLELRKASRGTEDRSPNATHRNESTDCRSDGESGWLDQGGHSVEPQRPGSDRSQRRVRERAVPLTSTSGGNLAPHLPTPDLSFSKSGRPSCSSLLPRAFPDHSQQERPSRSC